MSRYTLCINITSDNKELLDNLMVTLESIHGDLREVDSVELFAAQDPASATKTRRSRLADPTTTQRNLFLDRWSLSEAV